MMEPEIDQQKIIDQVTAEIFKEIKTSGKVYTNQQIQEKIVKRLNQIFSELEKKHEEELNAQYEKDEEFIKNEFTKIDTDLENLKEDLIKDKENADEEEQAEIDKLLESLCGDDENDDTENNENNNEEESGENSTEEPEKKKFLQEIGDLYKQELKNSLDSFKTAFGIFSIMKKTSIIEKAFIFALLILPSLLAGCFVFILLFILFILWQFSIVIKAILKKFENLEVKVKAKMDSIKKKIASMKSGSGFINRLLFSNALYSLVMFNGVLYLLIKGVIVPLKSALEIDRVVANFISKGVKGISIALRAPSEFVLGSTGANALKRGKGKQKNIELSKKKLQLKDLLKAKQNLNLNKKNLNMFRGKKEMKNSKAHLFQNINKKLQDLNKQIIQEKVSAINEMSNKLDVPLSLNVLGAKLSTDEKINNMAGQIMNNLFDLNIMPNKIKDIPHPLNEINKPHQETKEERDYRQMQHDIKEEKVIANRELQEAKSKMTDILGMDPKQEKQLQEHYERLQENNISSTPTKDALEAFSPNWNTLSEDEKIRATIAFADSRGSREDQDECARLEEWTKNNYGKDFSEYVEERMKIAKGERQEEEKEFQDRYNCSCADLIDNAMKDLKISKDTNLSTEQFIQVATHAVDGLIEKGELDPDKKYDMIKDLREYNQSYIDYQELKEKYNYHSKDKEDQKETSKTSFVEKEKERQSTRSNSQSNSQVMTLGGNNNY